MNNAEELSHACQLAGVEYTILSHGDAVKYIDNVITKFNPNILSGHLAIQSENSLIIPLEPNEFNYPGKLKSEEGFIFFDQTITEKHTVFVISEVDKLGQILEECYGMEYFLSNKKMEYLIAVNWYSIECIGTAKETLKDLSFS